MQLTSPPRCPHQVQPQKKTRALADGSNWGQPPQPMACFLSACGLEYQTQEPPKFLPVGDTSNEWGIHRDEERWQNACAIPNATGKFPLLCSESKANSFREGLSGSTGSLEEWPQVLGPCLAVPSQLQWWIFLPSICSVLVSKFGDRLSYGRALFYSLYIV
jgi:hypothetical protein